MTDRTAPTEPTWKTVPEEPTPEMIAAFWRQKNNGTQEIGTTGDARSDYDAYRAMLAASPAAPGAEVEPVAWCAFAENGNVRLWSTEHARQVRAGGYFLDMQPLYLSPPTPDAIRAQARREALEEAERSIKRLKGTLSYIAAQAKAGYPTALSVIRANAESALDDEWQKTVSEAQALLSKKVDDQ